MAWTFFWIAFVALTTTSAYRYPHPSYHPQYRAQDFETSQYQTADDGSLEQASDLGEHQGSSEDIQNYQDEAESRLWSPKRPIERIIPFGYYGENFQDKTGEALTFNNVLLRSKNSSYNFLDLKTYHRKTNRKEAVENEIFSLGPKSGSRNMFIPQIDEECEKSGICENSPDYPHEYVEALLAKLPDANIRFNLDMETPETTQNGELETEIDQTVLLCKAKYRIIYPDKAKTKTGKWVFIVNGRTTKVQGFSGTECLAEDVPCDGKIMVPKDYYSTCVQKRIDRSMWGLDYSGELTLVTARVPSCCTCELRTNKTNHQNWRFP